MPCLDHIYDIKKEKKPVNFLVMQKRKTAANSVSTPRKFMACSIFFVEKVIVPIYRYDLYNMPTLKVDVWLAKQSPSLGLKIRHFGWKVETLEDLWQSPAQVFWTCLFKIFVVAPQFCSNFHLTRKLGMLKWPFPQPSHWFTC